MSSDSSYKVIGSCLSLFVYQVTFQSEIFFSYLTYYVKYNIRNEKSTSASELYLVCK